MFQKLLVLITYESSLCFCQVVLNQYFRYAENEKEYAGCEI